MLLSAFRPTTVRVPGAPTSRINQALEFRCRLSNHALPIAAPGYRLSAHPWFQLGLLFWNVPPLGHRCVPLGEKLKPVRTSTTNAGEASSVRHETESDVDGCLQFLTDVGVVSNFSPT